LKPQRTRVKEGFAEKECISAKPFASLGLCGLLYQLNTADICKKQTAASALFIG
jgi:hypothetical protein